MKFEPRILFLITAIACLVYLIKNLIEGPVYNGIFFICIFWVFAGIYLYKKPIDAKLTVTASNKSKK